MTCKLLCAAAYQMGFVGWLRAPHACMPAAAGRHVQHVLSEQECTETPGHLVAGDAGQLGKQHATMRLLCLAA